MKQWSTQRADQTLTQKLAKQPIKQFLMWPVPNQQKIFLIAMEKYCPPQVHVVNPQAI